MPSSPPDPSVTSGLGDIIRQELVKFLRDPTQLPDEYTAWLSGFVALNATTPPINPNSTTPPPVI